MTAFMAEGRRWERGVYHHYIDIQKDPYGIGETEELIEQWITSPLSIVAILRTLEGEEHSYLVEYISHGETEIRRAVLPQSLLIGRYDEALRFLRSIGISTLHQYAKIIRQYLDAAHLKFSTRRPSDFWILAKSIGWHGKDTFVLPNEIIGNQNQVWYDGKGSASKYAKKGTLAGWQGSIATPCIGNPYLIFGLSLGFAGPLLEPLNILGIAFHFHGDSSSGKTTAQCLLIRCGSRRRYKPGMRQ
jgi:putative DNA primase/helicase